MVALLLSVGTGATATVHVLDSGGGWNYALFLVPVVFLIPVVMSHRIRIYSTSIQLILMPFLRLTIKIADLKKWGLSDFEYVPTGLLNRGIRYDPLMGLILSNRNGYALSLRTSRYTKLSITLANQDELNNVRDVLTSLAGPQSNDF